MFEVIEGDVESLLHAGRLVPIHALTRGLTARGMRSVVRNALEVAADSIADPLPAVVRGSRELMPLGEALRQIHFPDDDAKLADARSRLAFEELFLLQSVLELRRRVLSEEGRGLATAAASSRAVSTRAVQADRGPGRTLAEIVADLRAPRPMHRLLIGDVGSGKTVVALLAALHVVEAGHQAVFMAPTEILARQHAATLTRFATPAGIAVAVLTGATPAAARRALATRLAAGEALLVVGTHALLEEKVAMPKLGLAIVDEQHRFGVKQRATLAKKGVIPDVLYDPTPIPRTLALAFYGDLETSRLRSRPAGRGRLVTRVTGEEKFPQVIEFMARELHAGRQAFVVLPVIEEGGRLEARAAQAEFERLRARPELRSYKLALLHGRLDSQEKQSVMDGFASGAIQVLVTTTVEVGVDVPARRSWWSKRGAFRLTQLHRCRTRRSRHSRSVCVLIPGAAAAQRARGSPR
jgi:ATP-dependent DNA helicase RecG